MNIDAHIKHATTQAAGVASPVIVAAASHAVASVRERTEKTELAEVAADMRKLRDLPALSRAVAEVRAEAFAEVLASLLSAMADGYREAAGEAEALGLKFSFTDQDATLLAGFPIVDAVAGEHADRLAADFVWRVRSVVTRAAIGSLPSEGIAQAVGETAQAWAASVGRLAGDAFQAGGTAARRAMAGALASMPTLYP